MYKINRTNGSFFASVPNNVILGPNVPNGTPTPINLIGRDKVSYGGAQNENFLWLTENFTNKLPPAYPIKGQLWYNTTNDLGTGGGGELMIAPGDGVSPTEWITVATIGKMNTEPSNSAEGRFIIFKNNTLKVRINKEWRTIVTEVPKSQQLQMLLPIRYNADPVNNVNTTLKMTGSSSSIISRFNEGGYLDDDGRVAGIEDGVLRYGAAYQYEADILGRDARDPAIHKFWRIRGTFYVDTAKKQGANPDPRRIKPFGIENYTVEIISSHDQADSWTISAAAEQSTVDPTLTPSQVLNGDFFGLNFIANLNKPSGTIPTQWSIAMRMTGLTLSPADAYSNL